MITIVYASRATGDADEPMLSELLRSARERNRHAGVTGLLLYSRGSFMQKLEGEEAAVEEIYASIEADSRHTDLRLLSRRPIAKRMFSGWWMGFERPDDAVLAAHLPSYRAPVEYPLVDPRLVRSTTVAEAVLGLYARNP